MPRDSVFTKTIESLPTGRPLVLYLPLDVNPREVGTLGLATRTGLPNDVHVVELDGDPVDPLPLARGQRCLSVWWARDGGHVTVGPGARAADGSELQVPGHHVDLDWDGCNRLIRFLRTARDQAFGRPE